ncbi:MAG: hypothetical protein HZA77_05870 [Candidatus Schekmanbacteria bacterium]|nr:hypothetical protein [Candidatus Schekmanbacteria bacterium]
MNSIPELQKNMYKDLRVSIGGVRIKVSTLQKDLSFSLTNVHSKYLINEVKEDISLEYMTGEMPALSAMKKLFESGGVWSLYENGSHGYLISFNSPMFGNEPYKVAYFNGDFSLGKVVLRKNVNGKIVNNVEVVNPFDYPLDELMMVNHLSIRKGIIIHGCFLNDSGKGLLFSGTSGAGKSTMATIWKENNCGTIFTDERVIIREQADGALIAYGTPWHGTAGIDLPESSSIDKIFFLKHASENKAELIGSSDSFSRLVVRSFPTFWSSTGMECTLSLISNIISSVPSYELGFLPDGKVIDYVRSLY